MNKAIKLRTDGHIEIIDVPNTISLLEWFYEQIGCSCIENVYPRGLDDPFMMVMDGEALLRDEPVINFAASWLYQTQKHGHPICGTVLIMQKIMTSSGPDIGGIPNDIAQKLACVLTLTMENAVNEIRKQMGNQLKS